MEAIAAMSLNRAIGKDGGLPWPTIKEDLRFFKAMTLDKKIIVGRKTFETLPPLRNRETFVLTRYPENLNTDVKYVTPLGLLVLVN